MSSNINSKLGTISIILCLAIIWVLASLYQELSCLKSSGWFSRSGAILVIASIWSGLITRPQVKSAEAPDLAGYYRSKVDGTEPPGQHWTAVLGISNKLISVEVLLAITGTIIWAYGDLWLPKC